MRFRQVCSLAVAVIAFITGYDVSAQEPDLSFGTNGKVYTSFGSFSSFCQSMILLPDEKLFQSAIIPIQPSQSWFPDTMPMEPPIIHSIQPVASGLILVRPMSFVILCWHKPMINWYWPDLQTGMPHWPGCCQTVILTDHSAMMVNSLFRSAQATALPFKRFYCKAMEK